MKEEVRRRYLNDAKFRALVMWFRKYIFTKMFTIQDLKDALELAEILESERPF